MKKTAVVCLFALCVLSSFAAMAKTLKVGLIAPRPERPYWGTVVRFTQEAANDFGIELRVYDAHGSHIEALELAKQAVSGPDKVDALLFQSLKGNGIDILKVAEAAGVPAIIVNGGLSAEDIAIVGEPRSSLKFWLGDVLPDDEWAGVTLTQRLLEVARAQKKTDADGKIPMLAINGPVNESSSALRGIGLDRVVKEQTDVNLLQTVAIGDWSAQEAQSRFSVLQSRYPQTTTAWVANANMAQGVIASIRESGLTPGKDILIGTFDVDEKTLQQIHDGEIAASIGGHFLGGAWAIVLLYDYFQGVDFAQESLHFTAPMSVVTQDNLGSYYGKWTDKNLLPENLTKVDFTRFSKAKNPSVTKYGFSVDEVISQL